MFVFAVAFAVRADHVIELDAPALAAEEGLLLGNGDLSCSVWQTADEVVFQFGKGDVWDRRLDLADLPPPATLREYRRGVLDEGWKCRANGDGLVATKGTRDEKRMREICSGYSRALGRHPRPCPKPTGELRMHLPVDLPGPAKWRQRIVVEEGRYEMRVAWKNGVTLECDAVVAPTQNVFSLAWKVDGWNDATKVGRDKPSLRFDLLRRADPDYAAWKAEYARRFSFPHFGNEDRPMPPLPPPKQVWISAKNVLGVEQEFPPDVLFPDGFKCRLALWADKSLGPKFAPSVPSHPSMRYVCFRPRVGTQAGELQVSVTTSRDASLLPSQPASHSALREEARAAARAHWSVSSLSVPGDRELENLWYATYHARRAVLRGGTVPPGLFLPSTINDYSLWHGDWHSNYNLQSIYWGDLTANRLDEAAAYFDAIDAYVPLGRKIAHDYYNCRGVFIQLEGFPLLAADDYNGNVPLGRMAYMTGWAMTRHFEYWLYTRDREFLAKRGYPFIRDVALFYLDFLLKAPNPDLPPELKDGKWHAFPSVDSEKPLTGNALDLADQPDTMRFIRHALYAAIETSAALGVDDDLRGQWRERLTNLAGEPAKMNPYSRHCRLAAPPEHGNAKPYAAPSWKKGKEVNPRWNNSFYFGMQTRFRIGAMRDNSYDPANGWNELRGMLTRWTHPNGLVWGMAISDEGRAGAWTESLSCMAPYQEMMLQSWDGAIRLFPWWPRELDAEFGGWRAQGAFVVSAAWRNGAVGRAEIFSEKGETCHLHGAWRVIDSDGNAVATGKDEFGRLTFPTTAGKTYRLAADGK